jgi:hypothetical protein
VKAATIGRDNRMEVFLAHGREQRVAETSSTVTVSEFLTANTLDGDLFLGDRETPLDGSKTLGAQGVKDRAKLFVGRCRRVDVTVRFGGLDKHENFPPGAAVAAVFAWATGKKGFDLPHAEAVKHAFQVCEGTEQPDHADHIGSWAGDDCTVCLDLVPKQKFEG